MNFKHQKRVISAFLIPAMALATTGISGCSAPAPANAVYSDTGMYLNTVISVTVYEPDDQPYIQDCFDMAQHYEDLLSRTIETSDISRINQNPGEFIEVDPDTAELINIGLSYCELSDGVFDITVGALSDLWDVTNNPGIIPDSDDIMACVNTIDYHNVEISGNSVRVTEEGTMIDLGAIAKGYIADQMKDYLIEQGVESAMINLGGNVLVIGSKKDGSDYTVGIQKPFDETNEPIASVSIKDKSVVSSGNYERYFELDGTIYHHILDTSEGYPVQNGLSEVTIISTDSVDGDALSTTCFALGMEKGIELLESLDHIEGIFVTDDFEVYTTSGMGTDVTYKILN